jgi:hypothetical protein
MPKVTRKSINTDQTEAKRETPKKERKPRRVLHPLEAFANQDHVSITTHSSPLGLFTGSDSKSASRMENKLANFLWDMNSPCHGQAKTRIPIGECEERVFDAYFSKCMPSHLYQRFIQFSPAIDRLGESFKYANIIYQFDYPNIPSFSDCRWAKNYVDVDQSEVAEALMSLGADITEEFSTAHFRCIVKSLIISYDTRTEVYYVQLKHWVQKQTRNGVWVDSF